MDQTKRDRKTRWSRINSVCIIIRLNIYTVKPRFQTAYYLLLHIQLLSKPWASWYIDDTQDRHGEVSSPSPCSPMIFFFLLFSFIKICFSSSRLYGGYFSFTGLISTSNAYAAVVYRRCSRVMLITNRRNVVTLLIRLYGLSRCEYSSRCGATQWRI